jgi:hypothetical protein
MTRPFSDAEKRFLIRLTETAEDPEILLAQIEVAKFERPWFEGSQSFYIATDPEAPRYNSGRHNGPHQTAGGSLVYVDGSAPDSDANFIGEAFLQLTDGLLTGVEYWWTSDEMPSTTPSLDQLVGYPTDDPRHVAGEEN